LLDESFAKAAGFLPDLALRTKALNGFAPN
jgi:hypothetical protein